MLIPKLENLPHLPFQIEMAKEMGFSEKSCIDVISRIEDKDARAYKSEAIKIIQHIYKQQLR